MQQTNINTLEYWNQKFGKSWDENGGKTQTMFFSSLILMALPQKITDEIREKQYSIGDVSCGEGDGLPILHAEFPANQIVGYDFSEAAILRARQDYPEFPFKTANLFEEKYPEKVLICSNTMEHFDEPWNVLERLTESKPNYIIIAVPWEEPEEEMQEEHVYRFDENNVLNQCGGYKVIDFAIFDTSGLDHTPWPGKQLIMIYAPEKDETPPIRIEVNDVVRSRMEESAHDLQNLSLLYNVIFRQSALLRNSSNRWQKSLRKEQQTENILECQNSYYTRRLFDSEQEIYNWRKRCSDAETQLHQKNIAILHRVADKAYRFAARHPFVRKMAKGLKKILKKSTAVEEKTSRMIQLDVGLRNYTGQYVLVFGKNQHTMAQAAADLGYYSIETADDIKVATDHLLMTIQPEEMASALDLIEKNFKKGILFAESDTQLEKFYDKVFRCVYKGDVKKLKFAIRLDEQETACDTLTQTLLQVEKTVDLENDVVVLSVIDWDYRFQRPQHIAAGLARLGNRVFYVNSTFDRTAVENKKGVACISLQACVSNIYHVSSCEEIYDVYRALEDVIKSHNIRNATLIVEYPLWQPIVEKLAAQYNFKIVFDYLDDFGGFTETNDNALLLPSFEKLREKSDVIFASSEYLYQKAQAVNTNVEMVRNGTEFSHFNQAVNGHKNERPVIGYYGAIADWFAHELIYQSAKKLTGYDFVLIGDYTHGNVEKLQTLSNVKFLGEKGYEELPQYLSSFDVALIPFDSSLELIKATNPVKFYEYLSAGKKIVATKIPELAEYEGRFALLENDAEGFASAIERCVNGTDGLANEEERIEFARRNDWLCRIEDIQKHLLPRPRDAKKASIIIITYNNLQLNQECLNSIFSKTKYSNYEVVVVDNASSDGTPEYLRAVSKLHSNMKVILNQENRGFAGGNNDGIRAAEGDYIVLLNNDTVVTPYWLNDLISHLKDDKVGMVGPVTNCIANEAQIPVAYADYSQMDEFAAKYTSIHKGEVFDIAILAMFCVAMTRATYQKTGEIDEAFGMGMFEDDDYAQRIHKQGLRVVCAEDVFVHHVGKQSFSKLDDRTYNTLFEKNKAIYEKKHGKWNAHKQRR